VKLFFYDQGVDGEGRYINCPPGTVVDENVVNDEVADFYLISQKSAQGVNQSTHYYIAYDDAKTIPTDVYSLIYKMTYLYFNWTGSIRIPAPCQYAKKLTQLIGEKLSDRRSVVVPHERFSKQLKGLYFL